MTQQNERRNVSYGIICYYFDRKVNKYFYLVYKRRDSYEYVDFIRGRFYSSRNLDFFLKMMTEEERERIATYSFDQLWDDIWINKTNVGYMREKEAAKTKFESYRNMIMKTMKQTNSVIGRDNGWEFPKGKKYRDSEDEYSAAVREFSEETTISNNKLDRDRRINPLYYEFVGTDMKLYNTIYFVSSIGRLEYPSKSQVNNDIRKSYLSLEAEEISWITIDEVDKYLDISKQNILLKIENILRTKNRDIADVKYAKIFDKRKECNFADFANRKNIPISVSEA